MISAMFIAFCYGVMAITFSYVFCKTVFHLTDNDED